MKKDGSLMYKSQLQEYAQKASLLPPTYEHVKEGASHEPRFQSTVVVNGQTYSSAPGFPNLRSAEHAAAKAALDVLRSSQTSGVVPSPVHESGLCKNLLQEYAQKNGYPYPQYKIMRQGEDHSPIFTSTVEIAGVSYSGGGAKNKKEAEIKAARTALLAIQATQPTAWGLPAVEPYRQALPQGQPGQVASFVKSHPKRKKRGRAHQQVNEEPLATRMKTPVGQSPVENTNVPLVSQVTQAPYVPQAPASDLVGTPGQIPKSLVELKLESGVYPGTAVVSSKALQIVDMAMEESMQMKTEVKGVVSNVQGVTGIKPFFGDQVPAREQNTTVLEKLKTEVSSETDLISVQEISETNEIDLDLQTTTKIAENKSLAIAGNSQTAVETEVNDTPKVADVEISSLLTDILHGGQDTNNLKQDLSAFQVDRGSVLIPGITFQVDRGSRITSKQNALISEHVIPLANGELQTEILQEGHMS